MYALENEKPKIENGSCPECENFCASQNGTACHDINTEGSKFYLTVYNDEPYVDSELALINVNEIIPFGKKVSIFISSWFIINIAQTYQNIQYLIIFHHFKNATLMNIVSQSLHVL